MSHKPSPAAILFSKIDPSEARGVIAKRLRSFEAGNPYTTAQLRDIIIAQFGSKIEFSKSDVYDWRTDLVDVFKEDRTEKARGFSDRFKSEEIEKILMAHYLWENGADRKHIPGVVRFWAETGKIEKKEVEIDIVERKRARLMLAGRLLSIIVGLITDLDGPPLDSILICREATDSFESESDIVLGTLESPPEIIPERTLVGYVKNIPEAEILAGIEDFSQFIPTMRNRQYYSIRVQAKEFVSKPIELIIGLRHGSLEHRGEIFLSRHRLGEIGQNNEKTKTAYKLLKFVFEKFFQLDKLFDNDESRFQSIRGSDQLNALTTTVAFANENWSSCIFWTKEGSNHLTIRGYSPGFTGDANKILTLAENLNLESFVYMGNGSILCGDVSDWKRRLPKEDDHISPATFAIVPAVSKSGIEGVLFVNAKPDSTYQFDDDLDVLMALGRILAETYAREKLADVSHLIASNLLSKPRWNEESALAMRIVELLDEEKQRQNSEKWDDVILDEYILLYMLKIDINGSRSLKRWYDDLFSQRFSTLLRQKISLISSGHETPRLYRLNPGNMIFLLPKIKISSRGDLDWLQEELFAVFSSFMVGFPEVQLAIWPVYFPYSLLVTKMKDRGLDRLEEHDLASIGQDLIINTPKRLFPIAQLLMESEHKIRNRDYHNAAAVLTEALSRDYTPGGSPFIYRRLADAYIGLGEWNSALDAAKHAIEAEAQAMQPYAGSYLRFALAQEKLNQQSEAIGTYREAARLSPEPLYQLEYARVLTLYGETEDQYNEADKILKGLRAITELLDERKAFVAYIQSLLLEKRGKTANEQMQALEIAARFDGENPYIELKKNEVRMIASLE